MSDPTNPYRDNPAHREIADLQRRLQGVIEDADALRDARDKARHKVDRLKRDLRCAERRHTSGVCRGVMLGIMVASLCVVAGYRMGSTPAASTEWCVWGMILLLLVVVAAAAMFAAMVQWPPDE